MKRSIPFIKILPLILALASQSQAASKLKNEHWDLSVDAAYRSYPSGAALGLEGGYSHLFWGNSNDTFRYGYVRSGARLQSSGVVSRGDIKVSVFPISILGVEWSSGLSHRHLKKIATLDCSTLNCEDIVYRHKISIPLYLGWQQIFARLRAEYLWMSSSNKTTLLTGDESLTLPFLSQSDRSSMGDVLLGYKFNETFKLISFYETAFMKNSKESRQSKGIMGEFSLGQQKQHQIYAGLGLHNSSFSPLHGQFLFAYSLSFAKSIGF